MTDVYVDTETTSLTPPWMPGGRRAWEVALIFDGGERPREHVLFIRLPSHAVEEADPESLALNGWHDRYPWRDGRPGPDVGTTTVDDDGVVIEYHDEPSAAKRIAALFVGAAGPTHPAVLYGANPAFDADTLHHLMWRHHEADRQPPWDHHTGDTTCYAAGSVGLRPPYSSRDVSAWVGVNKDDFGAHHTALADARWCRAVDMASHVIGGDN